MNPPQYVVTRKCQCPRPGCTVKVNGPFYSERDAWQWIHDAMNATPLPRTGYDWEVVELLPVDKEDAELY